MTAAHLAEAQAFMLTYDGNDHTTGQCAACGREWPMLVLDGKPSTPQGQDFDRLEGPCCYGEGYSTP